MREFLATLDSIVRTTLPGVLALAATIWLLVFTELIKDIASALREIRDELRRGNAGGAAK